MSLPIRIVHTDTAPEPRGHRAQALVHDNVIYVSGQLPVDPVTSRLVKGGMEEQTERALANIAAILAAAESGLHRVLSATVYITDMTSWEVVDRVFRHHFKDHRPARSVVPVNTLHYGALVEIDVIAAAGS